MVSDYLVVYEHEVWRLQAKIKELLDDGWQPFGQFQMSMPVTDNKITPCFAQVMVKPEPGVAGMAYSAHSGLGQL